MKSRLFCIGLFLLLISAVFASTRTVDGVGGASLTFATVKEALIDLGASADSSDGTTDTITLTADITEQQGFCVVADGTSYDDGYGSGTYQALTDAVIIDGENHVVSIVRGAEGGGDPASDIKTAVIVYYGNDSNVTLRNMTIMPDTSLNTGAAGTAISIEDRHSASVSNVEINLEGVIVTGNDGSGNPLTRTESLPPGGSAILFGPNSNEMIRVSNNSGTDSGSINLTNCDILYCPIHGLYINTEGLDFNLDNVFVRGTDNGILWNKAVGSNITMTGCTSRENVYGCIIRNGHLTLMDNCSFIGNSDVGFRTNNSTPAPIVDEISNCIFSDNTGLGLVFEALDLTQGDRMVNKCLFANNGDPSKSALVNVSPSNAGTTKTISFTESTFHNPANGVIGGVIFVVINPSCSNLLIDIRDSIFSGNTGDTVAFNYNGGAGIKWSLTNCSVVTNGPDALDGLGDATAESGVIYDDPQYKGDNTNPTDADSFVVQNTAYKTAGTGGVPLEGWGGYEPVSLVRDWLRFK